MEHCAISASQVRALLKEDKLNEVKNLVPYSTYEYLISEKGKEITERIKNSNSVH